MRPGAIYGLGMVGTGGIGGGGVGGVGGSDGVLVGMWVLPAGSQGNRTPLRRGICVEWSSVVVSGIESLGVVW